MRWGNLTSILIVLAWVVFPSNASAAETRCHSLPTSDEIRCLMDVLKKAEGELREKYAAVREQLDIGSGDPAIKRRDAAHQKQLDLTQKSWRAYVEQTCTLVGLMFEGGTLQVPAELRCTLELTQQRIGILDRLFYQEMKSD